MLEPDKTMSDDRHGRLLQSFDCKHYSPGIIQYSVELSDDNSDNLAKHSLEQLILEKHTSGGPNARAVTTSVTAAVRT